jgi:hypothetical protein
VFQIGYEGLDLQPPGELRFRLTLEPAEEGDESYEFDQRRTRAGWFTGDAGQVLYRSQTPLRDGTYLWRAWYWNGTDWAGGTAARELRIDTVPPAEVGALRVSIEADGTQVRLEWDPVVLDRAGAPEFVTLYRIYRYEKRKFPGGVKTLEIGEAVEPWFVDHDARASEAKIVYYKVTAVDQAGNESERKSGAY